MAGWGNPRTAYSTTRPSRVASGSVLDVYYDNSANTPIDDQAFNDLLEAIRQVARTAGTANTEGDDDILVKGIRGLGREKLTADRTYYVRPDGNDSNDGLVNSAGRAFLTLQRAADAVIALDLNSQVVTIAVADGTYTAGILIDRPVNGYVVLQGNLTTPGNCIISVAGNPIRVEDAVQIEVAGFKLTTTGVGNDCLMALSGARIIVNGLMEYGASGGSHITANQGGIVNLSSTYTISGGAQRHYQATNGGVISVGSFSVTLTGTPAFTIAYAQVIRSGNLSLSSTTAYSGAATGKRYWGESTARLVVPSPLDPETIFPGDAHGTIEQAYHAISGMRNLLVNPSGRVQDGLSGAVADGVHGLHSVWYALTQTGAITPTTRLDAADGLPHMMRLTQSLASAQRFGYAQIIEGSNCKHLRGRRVSLSGKIVPSATATLRLAILEWAGTEDAPVRDVVNDWTSGTMTVGNFFISNASLLLNTASSLGSISGGVTTPFALTVTLGSTFNNLIVLVYTSTQLAQNVTVDFIAQLEEGEMPTRFERRPLALERAKVRHYEQRKTVQTENGARHIPLTKMRATPTITASVGTPASANQDGFELSHTSAASSDILADARLGV